MQLTFDTRQSFQKIARAAMIQPIIDTILPVISYNDIQVYSTRILKNDGLVGMMGGKGVFFLTYKTEMITFAPTKIYEVVFPDMAWRDRTNDATKGFIAPLVFDVLLKRYNKFMGTDIHTPAVRDITFEYAALAVARGIFMYKATLGAKLVTLEPIIDVAALHLAAPSIWGVAARFRNQRVLFSTDAILQAN